jgi:hypothetical protein
MDMLARLRVEPPKKGEPAHLTLQLLDYFIVALMKAVFLSPAGAAIRRSVSRFFRRYRREAQAEEADDHPRPSGGLGDR